MAYRDLLPPYMNHQAWADFADAIEEVFGTECEPTLQALKYLRTLYPGETTPPLGPDAETLDPSTLAGKIGQQLMLSPNDFTQFDTVTETRRLNMLGLHVSDPTLLDPDTLRRLVQNIAQFWFSKGRGNMMEFLAYCLNADISIKPLWTNDYIKFYEAGSPTIGVPVWLGGSWYPTTHVRLVFNPNKYPNVTFQALSQLFYDISNYNLVLDTINSEVYFFWVLEADQPGDSYLNAGSATVAYPAKFVNTGHYSVIIHDIN